MLATNKAVAAEPPALALATSFHLSNLIVINNLRIKINKKYNMLATRIFEELNGLEEEL